VSAYRRQIVGLPLQRSLFAGIDRIGEILGLADLLPRGRFGARVDGNGDLHLDPRHRTLLAEALPGRLTVPFLEDLDRRHRTTCISLLQWIGSAEQAHATAEQDEARAILATLTRGIVELLPWGILSKFVPDALLAFLRANGDDAPPPFPARSAGSRLADGLRDLRARCTEAGWPPARLGAGWPAVDEDVARAVWAFCADHAGFGPLAWDSPGYESPEYVLRMLRATEGGEPAPRAAGAGLPSGARAPSSSPPRPDPPPPVVSGDLLVTTRGVLAFWLDFLEWETWYVRRAFYAGVAPLLRRLAALDAHGGLRPDEMLFLEIPEPYLPCPDAAAARARRDRYRADSEYLARHAVGPGRLAAMMEA
jgi:hypothetical protein